MNALRTFARRRRWRILLPFMLLLLGCNPSTPTTADQQYVTMFGHRSIVAPGAPVEIPLLLRYTGTNQPVSAANVNVALGESASTNQKVFSGHTDASGMVLAKFTMPTNLAKPDQFIIVTSDQLFGEAAFSRPVYVGTAYNVLISTDKPIYQPGQTVHIRTLALDNTDLHAAAGQSVQVKLQDPHGLYLLDQTLTLSEWGIGGSEFDLDSQAPPGKYQISATIGPQTATRTVEVKAYKLPKFGIKLTADKRYYDIQDTVKGEVQATYFFGKPVSGGQVSIQGAVGESEDNKQQVLALDGQTDEKGVYTLDFPVPDYFFNEVTAGSQDLDLKIAITDTAGNVETSTESLTISADPLQIKAMPEAGFLHPGVENIVYLDVSEPDGTPVQASMVITSSLLTQTVNVTTDAFGLGLFRLKPQGVEDATLNIVATTANNVRLKKAVSIGSLGQNTSVLVRPERAEYHVGETVNLSLFATGDVKTVYLDIAKERQTVDFRSIDLSNGQATSSLTLDGSLLGTLEINAYATNANGELTRDRRLILVNPPAAKLDIKTDAQTYKPGGQAHLTMQVSLDQKPLSAALDVSIVDESVFAVGAVEPGFVRTYFLMSKALEERRYGIKGFTPFGDNAPASSENDLHSDGIQTAADHALMGALAEDLQAAPKTTNAPPGAQLATHNSPLTHPWSGKLLLIAPLLGLAFYDERKSWRKQVAVWTVLVAGAFFWASCAAGGPAAGNAAPSAPSAPAQQANGAPVTVGTEESNTPRVRQFFPETLFWQPEVLTDAQGKAELDVPIADSITTWRVSVMASTKTGVLGSAQAALPVFQDFFIEPNVPAQLTQNDETEIAVSLYNYLSEPQTITLQITGGDWLQVENGQGQQTLALKPNEVTVALLPIHVLQTGQHTLTVTARGTRMSDAVARAVTVLPDGRKVTDERTGVLARSQTETLDLPKEMLTGTAKLVTRIYPSRASQFPLDLPDAFYRDFCFNSDLGALQPIALAALYLKESKQLTPEQQLRTERLLRKGYQRLLRYYSYVDKGGFTGDCHLLFRNEPDPVASAEALVGLADLSKLVYVDPQVVKGTLDYIVGQQQSDGRWEATAYCDWLDCYGYSGDAFYTTANIAWSLSEAGLAKSEPVQRALTYLKGHQDQAQNAFVQAILANTLSLADPEDKLGRQLLDGLIKQVSQGADDGDTSALIALALVRSGRYLDETEAALVNLQNTLPAADETSCSVDCYRYSYPGRIYGIRALLLDARKKPGQAEAEIALSLNQTEVTTLHVTPQNSLLQQQAVITGTDTPLASGKNELRLRLRGDAAVSYAVTTEYYVPWALPTESTGPVALNVTYQLPSSGKVKVGDYVEATATLVAQAQQATGQLIVELTVPPGFYAYTPDLDELQAQNLIDGYYLQSNQLTVLVHQLETGQKLVLPYRLQANVPGTVRIRPSRVYQAVTPADSVETTGSQTLVTVR